MIGPIDILRKAGISVPAEAEKEISEAMLKLKQLSAKLTAWNKK